MDPADARRDRSRICTTRSPRAARKTALRDLRVKVGEGVAGWVVEHGETLIVPEADRRSARSARRLPTA